MTTPVKGHQALYDAERDAAGIERSALTYLKKCEEAYKAARVEYPDPFPNIVHGKVLPLALKLVEQRTRYGYIRARWILISQQLKQATATDNG